MDPVYFILKLLHYSKLYQGTLLETFDFPADNLSHTKFPANPNTAGKSAGIAADITAVFHMGFPADFPAVCLCVYLFSFPFFIEFLNFRY